MALWITYPIADATYVFKGQTALGDTTITKAGLQEAQTLAAKRDKWRR